MFPISNAERRSFAALALVLAAAAFALASVPLFNYLGYEFSAVFALLWPLTAGAYTLRSLLRRWPRGSSLTTAALRSDVVDLLAQNGLLLLVPLSVALGAGIVVRKSGKRFADEGLFVNVIRTESDAGRNGAGSGTYAFSGSGIAVTGDAPPAPAAAFPAAPPLAAPTAPAAGPRALYPRPVAMTMAQPAQPPPRSASQPCARSIADSVARHPMVRSRPTQPSPAIPESFITSVATDQEGT